ncbi:transposase family protein [Streptomyces dangxiongensis]|uniref:transposase family protein n=1 Tax=Streptomyces dangxiongensis TaxID=1442032 RepID=UPI001F099E47|nr:transposase family protein [Streptomyces dangxiongensis]
MLCAAVSAVLAGARSLIATSEWITDAPQYALGVLGFAADPLTGLRPVPHAAAVRRLLQRETVMRRTRRSALFCRPEPHPRPIRRRRRGRRRVIAVDGNVLRGSRTKTPTAVQTAGCDGPLRRGPGPRVHAARLPGALAHRRTGRGGCRGQDTVRPAVTSPSSRAVAAPRGRDTGAPVGLHVDLHGGCVVFARVPGRGCPRPSARPPEHP